MTQIDLTLPEPTATTIAPEAAALVPVAALASSDQPFVERTAAPDPRSLQVSVMVVDDQTLLRSGLVRLLEDDDRLRVVAVSKGSPEVATICAQLDVDVVVTDLHLSSMDAIELTSLIGRTAPRTRVLILAATADARVVPALTSGAVGFVLKDAEPEAIRSMVICVHHGEYVLCAEAAQRLLDAASGEDPPARRLTRRETEVLRLVAAGTPNRGIADILQVSDKTVRNYVSRLYHKLALENRAQIVRYAIQTGISIPVERGGRGGDSTSGSSESRHE